ncbi:DUF6776 family protein [Chitinolyticbacter meiyuanensis]|uniref:DUF6776 family protein n=1 Tax=Chitinolyticbacter meiyuanensis TaxID=682798 RepID=UPI0011E5A016|nr:DUF6776 family protein [Chitinolyticbacter meiyuanensis]
MPLRRLYRLQRARLTAAPLVLRPALGWRGRVGQALLWLLILGGIAGGAAWWAYHEGEARALGRLSSSEADVADAHRRLLGSRENEARLRQQLQVAEAARASLAQSLDAAQRDAAQAREALAFFDTLLTSNDRTEPVRFVACEFDPTTDAAHWRYRVLLVQGVDRTEEIKGDLVVSIQLRQGAATRKTIDLPKQAISVRHYRRIEGEVALPSDTRPVVMDVRMQGSSGVLAQCQKKMGGV